MKTRIGPADDPLEREADRIADAVVFDRPIGSITRMPAGTTQRKCAECEEEDERVVQRKCAECEEDDERVVQRKCAECAEEEEDTLQRKEAGPTVAAETPASVYEVLRSPGRPLDAAMRAYFEPRFGADFSGVRVHADEQATASARAINALAYTAGRHIVFRSNTYSPTSDPGRRLLAHELTHTIQQSSGCIAEAHGASNLQRSPDDQQEQSFKEYYFGSRFKSSSSTAPEDDDPDALYFGSMPFVCSNCHQRDEQRNFPTHKMPSGERVREWKIRDWAVQQALNAALGVRDGKKSVFSLLQRKEDRALHKIWRDYLDGAILLVLYDNPKRPIFTGSDSARKRFAKHLADHYEELVSAIDEAAVDRLVLEIKSILLTGIVLSHATLETDAEIIDKIESNPSTESIEIGNPRTISHQTITVGWEWQSKRIRSISDRALHFEVIGHEGIYFRITHNDFQSTDPFWTKVASDVAANTRGIVVIGNFIKGFLNALISPVTMVLDTTAKIIDMATMAAAAVGKERGWYDIGYTCLSSTCQNYERCLDSNKSSDECKSVVLKGALEEATIIIPLYRQGRDCLAGNEEACGAIAALALGLVKIGGGTAKGGRVLTKAEFEAVAIREAIGRRRAGDPQIAQALERGKAPKEARPSGAAKQTATAKSEVTEPRRIEAEVAELPRNASDPAKVHRLEDKKFDAEIATSDSRVTYKRERGTSDWYRCWNPCERKGQVGRKINEKVEATLKESEGKKVGAPAKQKSAVSPVTSEFKRQRLELLSKIAENQARAKRKAARSAEKSARQDAKERLAQQIADERERRLVAANEISKIDDSGLGGREKTVQKAELRQEIARRNELLDKLQAELDRVEVDPRARLRAYSYSEASGIEVTNRGRGVDEYSSIAGGPGKKVKEPSIDHLNSIDEIFELRGFWELFEDGQRKILSEPGNLFLMEKSLNSSKRNRRNLADWKEGRYAYGKAGIAEMVKRKSDVRAKLQAKVDELPKKPVTKPTAKQQSQENQGEQQ